MTNFNSENDRCDGPQSLRDVPIGPPIAPLGFVWLIHGILAGTPWPGIVRDAEQDLKALHSMGITRLVSLTEMPFDSALAARHGISCSGHPIQEKCAPSMIQGWTLCSDIERFIRAGDVIAVHGMAGFGRTGLVLAAYWIWRSTSRVKGLQAIAHVRRLEPRMIQSRAQVEFVKRFADHVADPPMRNKST